MLSNIVGNSELLISQVYDDNFGESFKIQCTTRKYTVAVNLNSFQWVALPIPAMKHVTCVSKMQIFTRIYVRILHVGTSANPHFTPVLNGVPLDIYN